MIFDHYYYKKQTYINMKLKFDYAGFLTDYEFSQLDPTRFIGEHMDGLDD